MDSMITEKLSPNQLAQLLTLDEKTPWVESDTGQVLRCQLHAALLPDLEAVSETALAVPALRQKLAARRIPLDQSLFGHLISPAPVLEVLQLIKQFARLVRDDMTSPLRGGPATVIYYAAIAAARVGCGCRISQVPDDQLRERFAWAKCQKGAERLSGLFAAATAQLSTSTS